MLNLSYAVDSAIWGLSSFGLHVTNVVLHITVVGLFYGWCTRALADARPDKTLTPEWPAFVAAATLAVHPVMAGAVLYLSARSELLAAVGVLACLTYARRAIVASSRVAAVLAIVFGILAEGSSSSAAVLPVLVLAYDAWVLRDKGWTRRAKRVYALAIVAVVIAASTQAAGVLSAARVPPRGIATHLVSQGGVVLRYVGLLVVPRDQSIVHSVRWASSLFDPIAVLLFIAAAGSIVYAIRQRHARPLVAFGVLWFAGVLAPTTMLPVRDALAEHRLYLASQGLLLAAAWALGPALATRRVARLAGAVALAVLAAITYHRNRVWLDPMQVWEEAVERSPAAWQAHLGYADVLRETDRCDRARPEYREVLRLYPDNHAALAGLDACP